MRDELPQYETLIVGATCTGLGCFLAAPKNALLLESSASVGWDFVETFRCGSNWKPKEEYSGVSQSVYSELLQREIVKDDRIHVPALGPVLHNRLLQSGSEFLFLTDIRSVQWDEESSAYLVELSNRSGTTIIQVKQIIDTTSHCISNPAQETSICEKSIGANLLWASTEIPLKRLIQFEQFLLIPGRFAQEAFLQLKLDVHDTWVAGREQLHQFWVSRPASLAGYTLVSVAVCLHDKPAVFKQSEGNRHYLPSSVYENPLDALSAGELFIQERRKQFQEHRELVNAQ